MTFSAYELEHNYSLLFVGVIYEFGLQILNEMK